MNEAKALIKQYDLVSHPEGGYFKEIWRSDIQANVTDRGYDGPRVAGSSIYYLVDKPAVLKWHRVITPQIYFWHAGGTFKLHFIDKDGKYFVELLGDTVKDNKCLYQVVIEDRTWIAGEVMEDGNYTLFSNIAVPGFDYKDWELGELDKMVKENPQHKSEIERLFITNQKQDQEKCSKEV